MKKTIILALCVILSESAFSKEKKPDGYSEQIIKGEDAKKMFITMGQNFFTKKRGNMMDIYRVIRSPDGLNQTVCEEEQNLKDKSKPSEYECKIHQSTNGKPVPVLKDGPIYNG